MENWLRRWKLNLLDHYFKIMKLTIGHYITIAMVGFMSFILYLVFTASSTNVDLTSEDYYKQEIEFESRIEAKKNSVGLDDEIRLIQDGDFTQIHFGSKIDLTKGKGRVHFYKPNNDKADKIFEFSPQKPLRALKSGDFEKGNYLVRFSWKEGDLNFFVEKTFVLK